tara:strand:+ start:352 stop:954 length:603 start_codon:yes stop_codon:yes gene_type:complete
MGQGRCGFSKKGKEIESEEEKITLEMDLRHWTETKLAKPYQSLNGNQLCPYARKAWRDDKVLVLDVSGQMLPSIEIAKNAFWSIHLLQQKDILILCDTEFDLYSDEQMFSYTDHLLNGENNGVWLIPFHPMADGLSPASDYSVDDYEPLLKKDYAMCFVQPTSHLNKASDVLEARGYYENWDELDLSDLKQRRSYGYGNG